MAISGQPVAFQYLNTNPGGALQDCDTAPSGVLLVNHQDSGITILVTHVSVGTYDINYTNPAFDAGDVVQFKIIETTGGLSRDRILFTETVVEIEAITTVTCILQTTLHLPIAAATIWATLDLLGTQVVGGYTITDLNGQAKLPLAVGGTYYFWAMHREFDPIQGEEFIAAETNTFETETVIIPSTLVDTYVTILYADNYLNGRLFNEAWFAASSTKKLQCIVTATRIIETLSFRGLKETTDQPLSWPRILETGSDPTTPTEIYNACCEIALALASGINPENEFRNVNKTSQGYGALRTTKDTTMVDPHLVHGIPSITAWNIMRPYLTDISCAVLFQGS
jgi:hypothetical protein